MKNNILSGTLLFLFCTITIQSKAQSNSQINDSQNEATKQLLGKWQVYRERVTGIMWDEEGMPYSGSYTQDVNMHGHTS